MAPLLQPAGLQAGLARLLLLELQGVVLGVPIRRFGAFLPGARVGGAGVHWNAQVWRFPPTDSVARSHNEARYGKAALDGLTIQDFPVTYEAGSA